MEDKLPVVSIVGRPNVGKSSLFNRVVGRRHAVVEAREGTTRDRIEAPIKIKNRDLILVDTGGFIAHGNDEMSTLVKIQIEKAIFSSDMLLFVCDGEKGFLSLDMDMAALLRRSGKKILLVVNKIDNEKRKDILYDFYEMGLGDPFGISCLHDKGIKNLLNEVSKIVPKRSEVQIEKNHPIKITIAGRPNVGKSSFLNKVLDEERVIVHEKPGTTRDSIDTYFNKDGILFLLVDTAGIRHKRKVKTAVDIYSMMRARDSIDRSDITLVLIDGMEGVTNDDIKIFEYVREQGKGCAIIVNKWDLVKEIEQKRYENAIIRRWPAAKHFPISFVSAVTGRGVLNAFNLVKTIKTNSDLCMDQDTLQEFLKSASPEDVKIQSRKKRPWFRSMKQVSTFPKEFF